MSSIQRIFLALVFLLSISSYAQKLKPGFDKAEYMEMLKIAQKQHMDLDTWSKETGVPDPQDCKLLYRSKSMALSNIWDLWMRKDSVAVISLRGTISDPVSFLANFYAAMVPAKGKLELEKIFTFDYNLCADPKAGVHVGWLTSMAYLQRDILPKIDSCYKKGIKNFIVTGHSQGAAIAFLLRAHLDNLQKENKIAKDIIFKTYCGAGPKPGNLYFAYHYENITRDGWGFNTVNTADWVPETPFSVQTLDDFNDVNIFKTSKEIIKKQKFPARAAMKHIYKKLSKPSKKAMKNYQKYLGKMVSKAVKKQLPEFKAPVYFDSNNYVRTGATIVLYAEDDYYRTFTKDETKVWQHHFIQPYLYLMNKLP